MQFRLHNAHRIVRFKTGVEPKYLQLPDGSRSPIPINWRQTVTNDVVKFIDDKRVPLAKLPSILQNPARYFCRSHNVPLESRKQIFLPNIVVTLLRTPHLPPKYASFYVPLWFNKLDMKDFLKRVYNVSVIHVRSYVEQQPVVRERALSSGPTPGRGRLKRPKSKKKMTVELEVPFIWPKETTDFSPWEKRNYELGNKEAKDTNLYEGSYGTVPQKRERRLIAEQARALLKGETKWRPSWQTLPMDNYLLPRKDSTAHFGP